MTGCTYIEQQQRDITKIGLNRKSVNYTVVTF